MLYKPYWELLSCILQHLSSNHLFQGTIGDPGIQQIFIAIESFALQTLENRAKACSNLHIVNRDSAFTTTPSMCLESWRVKQNHLNLANLLCCKNGLPWLAQTLHISEPPDSSQRWGNSLQVSTECSHRQGRESELTHFIHFTLEFDGRPRPLT